MKKGAVVVWIVALMLITTGVMLSPTSSQASDWDQALARYNAKYNVGRMPGDKVIGVSPARVSSNDVKFNVDISVDPAHLSKALGNKAPASEAHVHVMLYDKNGNRITRGYDTRSGYVHTGRSQVITRSLLKKGMSVSQVNHILVGVSGMNPKNTFRFYDIFRNANGAWVAVRQLPTPPLPKPKVPHPVDPRTLKPGKGAGGE